MQTAAEAAAAKRNVATGYSPETKVHTMPIVYIARTIACKLDPLILAPALNRGCVRDHYRGARQGTIATDSLSLKIERAVTEDEPITGLPWPPPGAGWALVYRRPADGTTLWRRIIQPKI
jgi:hypothetical protein